jgi:hypothetical protein
MNVIRMETYLDRRVLKLKVSSIGTNENIIYWKVIKQVDGEEVCLVCKG